MQTNHLHAEYVLVIERLHLLVGNVDAQLFVRVNDKILEAKDVEDSDCTTVTSANSKPTVIYYSSSSWSYRHYCGIFVLHFLTSLTVLMLNDVFFILFLFQLSLSVICQKVC